MKRVIRKRVIRKNYELTENENITHQNLQYFEGNIQN